MNIRCPIPQCSRDNPPDAVHCASCGANLQAYGRLLFMSDDLFNRGLSLSQDGHFHQAEQYLQASVLFNSKDFEAILLLAEVQALQGSKAAATATLERAREVGTIDPDLETMMKALQRILVEKPSDTPQTAEKASTSPPVKQDTKSSSAKRRARRKRKKKRKR